MDIKESAALQGREEDHWYYRAKSEYLRARLARRGARAVLDVGAGSGFFSRYLLANSSVAEAWCVDPNYVSEETRYESGKPVHRCRTIGAVDADLVLLMDVLEHVDDDVALLREYAGKASAQARFVVSVPAFQFMWSGHDDFLEHKRRYTLEQLEAVVAAAGLRVEESSYFFAAIFPMALLWRVSRKILNRGSSRASDMRTHSRPVNWMLYALSKAEMRLLKRNRAFGLTAFCVAVRT